MEGRDLSCYNINAPHHCMFKVASIIINYYFKTCIRKDTTKADHLVEIFKKLMLVNDYLYPKTKTSYDVNLVRSQNPE